MIPAARACSNAFQHFAPLAKNPLPFFGELRIVQAFVRLWNPRQENALGPGDPCLAGNSRSLLP